MIWPNSGHLFKNTFLMLPFHLPWYRPLCSHTMAGKTGESSSLYVARLRDTVVFSSFKNLFFLDSVQNSVMLEQKMKKRQAVVFLIYVFANVLISNMLHKVECVFQPDELSLWRGHSESRELRVRGKKWKEGGRGGGVFNMGEKNLCIFKRINSATGKWPLCLLFLTEKHCTI